MFGRVEGGECGFVNRHVPADTRLPCEEQRGRFDQSAAAQIPGDAEPALQCLGDLCGRQTTDAGRY
jgi:hypothetical protein